MKHKFKILSKNSLLNDITSSCQRMNSKLTASNRSAVDEQTNFDESNQREKSTRLANDNEKQIHRLYKSL